MGDAIQGQLPGFGFFRLQIRVTRRIGIREVEIVERRRPEAGAIAAAETVIGEEGPAPPDLPGVVAAILLVIVGATTKLRLPRPLLELSQRIQTRVIPAMGLIAVGDTAGNRIRRQLLAPPIHSGAQPPGIIQRPVVQPAQIVLADVGAILGFIATAAVDVVVEILASVVALQLALIAAALVTTTEGVALVLGPGFLALMLGTPTAGKGAVVLRLIAEPARRAEQAEIRVHRMLIVEHGVVTLVAVFVAIIDARNRVSIVAILLLQSGRPLELAGGADGRGAAPIQLPFVVRTGTGIQLVCPGADLGAGDDVDHAADGIGTIDGGPRPTDVLNPFDLIERQIVEIHPAGGDRVDAHTIHQHQGLRRGATAHREGGILPATAVADDLDAGQRAHHLGDCLGLHAVDLVAGDYVDGSQNRGFRLRETGRGDDHGLLGGKFVGLWRRNSNHGQQSSYPEGFVHRIP